MTDSEAREMARDLVRGSIIEDAAAQFIAQILKHAHDDRIKPLKARIEALEAALREIGKTYRADNNRPINSGVQIVSIARAALKGDDHE